VMGVVDWVREVAGDGGGGSACALCESTRGLYRRGVAINVSPKATSPHPAQVGAALSMVYKTGIPIVYLGVGQKYQDLRKLNVGAVVRALLA
jgi:hypothetical protein